MVVHPFRIQSDPNGSTGTQYNDGITNNDAGDGVTLNWNVQFDAPEVLYYQCTSHGSMGGKIYIGNSGESIIVDGNVGVGTTNASGAVLASNTSIVHAGIVTANYYYGDGANLINLPAPAGEEISIILELQHQFMFQLLVVLERQCPDLLQLQQTMISLLVLELDIHSHQLRVRVI